MSGSVYVAITALSLCAVARPPVASIRPIRPNAAIRARPNRFPVFISFLFLRTGSDAVPEIQDAE
jgi:hypothetical protein